jgi:hypothetical protein
VIAKAAGYNYNILQSKYVYNLLEEIGVSCMIKDRLTYIMEAAARLSPENQDRIIMAIEQLLGYEKKKIQLEFDPKKALSEQGTDA